MPLRSLTRWMYWRKYDASCLVNSKAGAEVGTLVEGDTSAKPTGRVPWLQRLFWKRCAIFSVRSDTAQRGYRIGFISKDGSAWLLNTQLYDEAFQLRVGHEDVRFFAIDIYGVPIEITLAHTAIKNSDGRYDFFEIDGDGREVQNDYCIPLLIKYGTRLERVPLF